MGAKIHRHKLLGPILMQTRPTLPIIVDDRGDLEVYRDVESACAALEIYDLADLWISDASGQRLKAQTHGYEVSDLLVDVSAVSVLDDLASRVTSFVERVGAERIGLVDASDVPLDQLLAALLMFFEQSR